MSTKLPPHSTRAEQAVIGSILIDFRSMDVAAEILRPDQFYHADYGAAYGAMLGLWRAGKPITDTSVVEALKIAGSKRQDADAYDRLDEAMRETVHAAEIALHASIVRDKAIARDVIEACQRLTLAAYGEQLTADDLVRDASESMAKISDVATPANLANTTDLVGDAIDRLHRSADGTVIGLDPGLRCLRTAAGLWRPGQLVIAAARPGMGKTAFALVVGHHVARGGGNVLFFSLEMSREEIGDRLLTAQSRVGGHKIRDRSKHTLSHAEELAIGSAPTKLRHDQRFAVDDKTARTPVQMAAIARRHKARHGLDLVMIDYIQLIRTAERKRDQSRQEEVASIARDMKVMARELNVPVLALAQLNRQVEGRADNTPRLSDLRESGAIEQDADMVLLLHRESYYTETPANIHDSKIIVAKNRNGPTGFVEPKWVPELSWFVDADQINDYLQSNFQPTGAPF